MSITFEKVCKVSCTGAFRLVAVPDDGGGLAGYAIIDQNGDVVRWARSEPDGEFNLEIVDPWPEKDSAENYAPPTH